MEAGVQPAVLLRGCTAPDTFGPVRFALTPALGACRVSSVCALRLARLEPPTPPRPAPGANSGLVLWSPRVD